MSRQTRRRPRSTCATFRRGPIFTNLLLADEINRATPKTQSAMLEAMQEHSVTTGGTVYKLPEPFMVLATQNPIEQEGTYPLPGAQLDRFFFKLLVPYSSRADRPSLFPSMGRLCIARCLEQTCTALSIPACSW